MIDTKPLCARMEAVAEELFEHADCIVVLASITDDDKGQTVTRVLASCRGNHYTRLGLAEDYVWELKESFSANADEDEEG